MDADTAIVFPGMGPQSFAEVGKFLLLNPVAKEMLAEASDTVGFDLLARYRQAEGDYAEEAQVVFLVTCLALARWAEQHQDLAPAYCVGPSFGGKAAAVYAGSVSLPDMVRLTLELARAEVRYFTEDHPGLLLHSFARTPRPALDDILAELSADGEWYDISCHVDHDFFMLSLRAERLEWLQQKVRAAGGLPLYTMDPPMHSAAFAPLRDRVARDLFADITFADPRLPVVADQDGSLRSTGDGVRTMLLDGIVAPVDWPRAVAELRRLGVGKVTVSGPDSLFGRVALTTKSFAVTAVNPRAAMVARKPAAVR